MQLLPGYLQPVPKENAEKCYLCLINMINPCCVVNYADTVLNESTTKAGVAYVFKQKKMLNSFQEDHITKTERKKLLWFKIIKKQFLVY